MPAQAAADSRAPASSIAVNVGFRSSFRSSIGAALRRSVTTNAARPTAATAIRAMVSVDPHAPRMSA